MQTNQSWARLGGAWVAVCLQRFIFINLRLICSMISHDSFVGFWKDFKAKAICSYMIPGCRFVPPPRHGMDTHIHTLGGRGGPGPNLWPRASRLRCCRFNSNLDFWLDDNGMSEGIDNVTLSANNLKSKKENPWSKKGQRISQGLSTKPMNSEKM